MNLIQLKNEMERLIKSTPLKEDGTEKETKEQIIEEFLEKLGKSSEGVFYLVCGKCGANCKLDDDDGDVEQEINGIYSDYTGHLWDTFNIKCKKCGNAISFDK